MCTLVRKRLRWMNYFSWFVFSGMLFIASEILRNATITHFFYVFWLDAAANFALLGALGVVLAFIGAVVLAQFEALALRLDLALLLSIPQGLVFAFFFAIWLNIVRLMLAASGIPLVQVPSFYRLATFFLIGVVTFSFFRKSLVDWIEKTTERLHLFARGSVIICVALTGYLVLEPLDKGHPALVVPIDSNRKHPNIIVIVLDSLTSRDMSLYGYPLPTTPNLGRITKTWTVYENAHSTGTGTFAFMPTLLTGRYPYSDEWYRYGDWVRAGKGWIDLAQVLQGIGYETMYVRDAGYPAGTYHFNMSWDRVMGGGTQFPGRNLIDHMPGSPTLLFRFMYDEYFPRRLGTDPFMGDKLTTTLSEPSYGVAEDLFRERAASKTSPPFFAYLHMLRPHYPYLANEFTGSFLPFQDGLTDTKSQHQVFQKPFSPQQQPIIDKLRLRYDENILKADAEVGHLIETLQQIGLYDDALIIITADHGSSFVGGYQAYGSPLLLASEHSIPLLVKFPGQTEGQRVKGLVSNVDIMPTVLDVVKVPYPDSYVDGQSLLKAGLDNQRVIYVRLPNNSSAASGPVIGAISNDLKLVSRGGKLFLFNLVDDPDEQNNLYGQVAANRLEIALNQFADRKELLSEGKSIDGLPALIAQ